MKLKNDILFNDLEINGVKLKETELIYSCNSEVYRLYIQRDNNEGFSAIGLYNQYSDNTAESWAGSIDNPLKVDVLFTASACFDGVRHLSFNEYINCPSLEKMTAMLKELRRLELEICPDADE